jgi:phosphopantothenoylcysteine decarboxylase/phosphopantothenate--cysteine ligase
MHAAVLESLPEADVIIGAAAVADFRPRAPFAGKLVREGPLTLELEPTEDIIADAVRHKRPGARVIAFAAEMGLDLERGRAKMQRKGVDAIVINDVSREGTGFDSDRNAGAMLVRVGNGERLVELAETSKREMARKILDEVARLRLASKPAPTDVELPVSVPQE